MISNVLKTMHVPTKAIFSNIFSGFVCWELRSKIKNKILT